MLIYVLCALMCVSGTMAPQMNLSRQALNSGGLYLFNDTVKLTSVQKESLRQLLNESEGSTESLIVNYTAEGVTWAKSMVAKCRMDHQGRKYISLSLD